MELETILTLVKAGYTKDEIAQMAAPVSGLSHEGSAPGAAAEAAAEAEPAQPAAQTADPVQAANAAQGPSAGVDQGQPTMNDLMMAVTKLTAAIQANAIANSVVPGAVQAPKAEDMLAEIIRPTFKGKELT